MWYSISPGCLSGISPRGIWFHSCGDHFLFRHLFEMIREPRYRKKSGEWNIKAEHMYFIWKIWIFGLKIDNTFFKSSWSFRRESISDFLSALALISPLSVSCNFVLKLLQLSNVACISPSIFDFPTAKKIIMSVTISTIRAYAKKIRLLGNRFENNICRKKFELIQIEKCRIR